MSRREMMERIFQLLFRIEFHSKEELSEQLLYDADEGEDDADAAYIREKTQAVAEKAAELERNLEKGEQSVLFLNRRGASRMATCVACGHVPQCQNCSAALTYHSRNNRLMCHYCGYSQPMPEKCPQCGEPLRMVGFGTQRVQQRLEEKFPGIQIIRMDADTTT